MMMQLQVLAIASVLSFLAAAANAAVSVQGAGATFPAPLYAKWLEAYNQSYTDIRIDYQAIGSGGGIKGITDRTVQFAGSDAPLSEDQIKAAGDVLHLPTVAGPEAMIVNLPDIKQPPTLDGPVIAGIFLGEITKWNDARIAALNPAIKLPALDIIVAHRSDGSGTTWIFTNYLCKVSPEWKQKAGNATSVKWPTGIGGKGNAGVADAVRNSPGAIGYVEFAYAKSAKFTPCPLKNKAGKVVAPTIEGVVAAAKSIGGDLPDDLRVSITDAPDEAAYPICGFTYFLVHKDLSYLKNPAQAEQLVKFITWCEKEGQDMAKDLEYARLSDEMRARVEAKIKTIVNDGKALVQ